MRSVVVVLVVCGCGRLDFAEEAPDAAGVALTATFGETGTAMFAGVTHDTTLDSRAPDNNFGLATGLDVDAAHSVSLLSFDVTAIASTAHVLSASLRISVNTDSSPGTVTIARVLEQWQEGNAAGAPGYANYNTREPGVPWSASGVSPPSREATPIGTVQPGALHTAYDVDLAPAAVQAWITDPATNFGMALLVDTSDGVVFKSSESGDHGARPLLAITYTP